MKWYFLTDWNWGKGHLVSDTLRGPIIENLKKRGMSPHSEERSQFAIDLPGMCLADRSWTEVRVGGLTVAAPTAELSTFYGRLDDLGVRKEIGVPYYKLHSWLSCLVLTREQRDQLLHQWVDLLDMADAIASAESAALIDRVSRCKGVVHVKPDEFDPSGRKIEA